MKRTSKKSNRGRTTRIKRTTSLAKPLAAEDIRPGDYVAMLQQTCELPSFFWPCDGIAAQKDEPVRIAFVPRAGGIAWRVVGVCLPFVLVKSPRGKQRTLDVRLVKLARLDRQFAKLSWKAYRATRSSS